MPFDATFLPRDSVCVELGSCAKKPPRPGPVEFLNEADEFVRVRRACRLLAGWCWCTHTCRYACPCVVRSWGTFVSYRNQPRHIPCSGYLGTRCFVTSFSCSSLLSLDRATARPRCVCVCPPLVKLDPRTVEFSGQRVCNKRTYTTRSISRSVVIFDCRSRVIFRIRWRPVFWCSSNVRSVRDRRCGHDIRRIVDLSVTRAAIV